MWSFTRARMWRCLLALGLLVGAAGAECNIDLDDDDRDLGDVLDDFWEDLEDIF